MYDVIVLGGGPAGVTAALRARELGAKVALIERDRLGGTCTNDGCVPTRVLAKAARLMRDAKQFGEYGLMLEDLPTVDFQQVIARTQQIVYRMHEKKQLLDHLRAVDIDCFDDAGQTRFVDPNTVRMGSGEELTADKFIICVGGGPRTLPFTGNEYALSHSDVWKLNTLPKRVVIVGTGATGCQLASVFNDFGAEVTLMDIARRILGAEDGDVAQCVQDEFEAHGIRMVLGYGGIRSIEKQGDEYLLTYMMDGDNVTMTVDAVIVSIGWPGNVEHLGLDKAGVMVDRSYIKVNDALQTTAPHIYAAGDITGRMMLVQSAAYQARTAAENAVFGTDQAAAHKLVPHGGFTDPEYAGVGLTEEQARKQGPVVVANVPYADLDRAVIDGHTVGFCKLIVDRHSHLVLGAHVVGEQAVEIVQIVAAGMTNNLRVSQLADLELAYPTFTAIVGLAARQISRELGTVPVSPEWRALEELRGSEWERLEA